MSARVAIVVVAGLAAGCFGTGLPAVGAYSCAAPPAECPGEYYCALDHRCWSRDKASCHDGKQDADETGVDCGGNCDACQGTVVKTNCTTAVDCNGTNCIDGHCELASGPPYWMPAFSLPQNRWAANTVAGSDGTLYEIAGSDGGNPLYDTVFTLDVQKNQPWTGELGFPKMSQSRRFAGSVFMDDHLYVVGGVGSETIMERYDFSTGAWQPKNPNTGFDFSRGASFADGSAFVVLGGNVATGTAKEPDTTPNDSAATGAVHTFTEGIGWTSISPIAPRRHLAAVLGSDNKYYAIGGDDDSSGDLARVEVYSKAQAGWSDGTPLPMALAYHAAAVGPDGRIYVAGGSVASGTPPAARTPSNVSYAFLPGDKHWATLSPTMVTHNGGGMAVGADGRVYIVGGGTVGKTGDINCEAYGPVVQLVPGGAVAVGVQPMAKGKNFAANAMVRVYVSTDPQKTTVASGMTNGGGDLAALALPAASTAGSTVYTFVDDRSLYPVPLHVTAQ